MKNSVRNLLRANRLKAKIDNCGYQHKWAAATSKSNLQAIGRKNNKGSKWGGKYMRFIPINGRVVYIKKKHFCGQGSTPGLFEKNLLVSRFTQDYSAVLNKRIKRDWANNINPSKFIIWAGTGRNRPF